MQQKTIIGDIRKIQKNRQALAILILFFVSIIFWVSVSLIASQTTEKISTELTDLAKPLTPTIDTEVFAEIEAKKTYTQDELSSFTIYKALTSKDGKSDRIVPLEVSIEDLEPSPTPNSASNNNGSLLESEVSTETPEEPTPENGTGITQ